MEKNKINKLNILKKVLSIAAKILYDILIFFCVILIVVVVWQRITDSNRSIYGYRLFRIISGSMVPEYNIDEVVICKEIDVNTLEIGDIIVYRGKVGELNNKLVMHEIININKNGEELTFHVKGIQNLLGDPNVTANQILGKVIFKSSILTYVYSLATNVYSSFIIIMVLVINVFIAFRPTRKDPKKLTEHNQEKNNDLKESDIENNSENKSENKIEYENKKEENSKIKRYKLKDYNNSIKIIKKDFISENEKESNNADKTEKLEEENRKLQEENKILKEKMKKIKEENKKEKDKK